MEMKVLIKFQKKFIKLSESLLLKIHKYLMLP